MIGFIIEGSALAGKALMDTFVEKVVEQAFTTAGKKVASLVPDFSSVTSLFNNTSDLLSDNLENQKSLLKSAIIEQAQDMDITIISNNELKALQKIALAVEQNGDTIHALKEWQALNKK